MIYRTRVAILLALIWLADRAAPKDEHWPEFLEGCRQGAINAYRRPGGVKVTFRAPRKGTL